MTERIKDLVITVVTVITAIFLTFFTQSQLPALDFLTIGNSLVAWGYFFVFYAVYFYIVSKVISFIRSKTGK